MSKPFQSDKEERILVRVAWLYSVEGPTRLTALSLMPASG